MSAQHTPGPWSRNIPPATKYTTVWSGRNKHVAYVARDGLTPDEVEANINLIAAAPELLAACELALDAATNPRTTGDVIAWRNSVIKTLKETIAAARGSK